MDAADRAQLVERHLDLARKCATLIHARCSQYVELEELVALLTRFRTLALASVTATLATSIERSIEALLADYLAAFLEADG